MSPMYHPATLAMKKMIDIVGSAAIGLS